MDTAESSKVKNAINFIKNKRDRQDVKSEASIQDGFIEKEHIKHEIEKKLQRNFGTTLGEATKTQLYKAVAMTVRDKILDKWVKDSSENATKKTLYYLSFEFLVGRTLENNLLNLRLDGLYKDVLTDLNIDLSEISEVEADAGLGNGGLGRLAACFMDSLATLGYPACGCGIRYEYGLFKQKIVDGYQIEMPDPWLEDGCVWEIEKPEEQVEVKFGGKVETYWEGDKMKVYLKDATTVLGVPYDMPVVGYNGKIVNTLRLWSARSPKYIDMNLFSSGSYAKAIEEKELAELLSKVLYPEDNHFEGKNLRLRQQYFFTSATIQWIVRSIKKRNINLYELPKYAQIHINDTHPAIAIPELMRILMDEENMSWNDAYTICSSVFAYTNHTILSEALEKWPQNMIKNLLPRIYSIIEELHHQNERYLTEKFGSDQAKINYMNIMSDGQISMANLCVSVCNALNGVSALHTNILKNDVFKDYYSIMPQKFKSITNGITFRRWLNLSNPRLTNLITEAIGDGFNSDPSKLKELEKFSTDSSFIEQFSKVKRENKYDLANFLQRENGIIVDPHSIFDVHIKRLHEYKRQLLNLLHIMYLYNRILANPETSFYPHTFIFSAKASPGYKRAKLIIKLINSVVEMVNNDPIASKKIRIVFIENYGVSIAQKIIPATNISEQISTAGKEASGTGNMKFMLNGAVTIGTLDGANVEMRDVLGDNNIYIFGLKSEEVSRIYKTGNQESKEIYSTHPEIRKILDTLVDGTIEREKPHLFSEIYQSLLFGDNNLPDPYMVIRDFESYAKTHEKMWKDYLKTDSWNEKAIINVANSGHFSSDRCIEEYNRNIWKLT
ncbi:MAG: glycogen/starch/alpha-glucan phosphorylase [Clostridiales bacterium]|nr:glycogen/starch/alpha-glucan phosphorylase [Clostridiales bacterium]